MQSTTRSTGGEVPFTRPNFTSQQQQQVGESINTILNKVGNTPQFGLWQILTTNYRHDPRAVYLSKIMACNPDVVQNYISSSELNNLQSIFSQANTNTGRGSV